jgi:hypothetical protein
MNKGLIAFAVVVASLFLPCIVQAQEVEVSTGFIFYAGKYTLNEEAFGVYADGHEFENLLKEVPAALDAFHSFETWHTMGNVFTSLSLVAFMFGGVAYMPGVKDSLPDNIGIYGVAAGGGLLVLGFVFEIVSWSSIGNAADLYNKDMEVDDGPALRLNPLPVPLLAVSEDGANFALSWRF